MTKRIWRCLAIGAVLTIVEMVLTDAGAIPDRLQWIYTPVDFIASLLRIGSHDGGIILIWFLYASVIFAAIVFPFDLLFTQTRKRRGDGPTT